MRKGLVLYNNIPAGELTETDDGEYEFEYNADYVAAHPDQLITFSLPVRKISQKSPVLLKTGLGYHYSCL